MRRNISGLWMTLACATGSLFTPCLQAGDGRELVLFQDSRVWSLNGDKAVLLAEDIKWPNNITVSTNGTFQVGEYPARPFVDGQVLASDGMLTSPDGRMEPVIDHEGMLAGSTFSSRNAGRTNATQNLQLGKDKVLTPDRVLLGRDGSWMRVIDGLLFTSDGTPIPAWDTITLQQGNVVVQKEGTQLMIPLGRSIMMNEGTKVFGDGRVLNKNGAITTLTEGQILIIEGVVKLR
jgi:hypothetical protein